MPWGSSTARGIPSLDGLRALSIALVLIAHLGGTRGFPLSEHATNYFTLGATGVRVFFVISGFLITTLLLREMEASAGQINLRRFYWRRSLRIFPPYFAFLAVLLLLRTEGMIHFGTGE